MLKWYGIYYNYLESHMDATDYEATLVVQLRINRENLPKTANCHQEDSVHNIMCVNNLLAGIQEPSEEEQKISLAQSLQPLNSINFSQAPHFSNYDALNCRKEYPQGSTQELNFESVSLITKTSVGQWRTYGLNYQQKLILPPWISGIV